MALFEDKRKPVNIYKKGSATEKAQSKMNSAVGSAFQGAANMADKYAGGAGARAIINPIAQGRENQKQFLASNKLNNKIAGNKTPLSGRADAMLSSGEQRFVGGNMAEMLGNKKDPVGLVGTAQAATIGGNAGKVRVAEPKMMVGHGKTTNIEPKVSKMALPTTNFIRNEQTGEVVSLRGDKVVNQDRSGNIIGKQSQKFTRQRNPNKFSRGNLDITFDNSVDNASRKRFLANPVRPTAQINRFNRQQAARGGMSQGQIASMSAERMFTPARPQQNVGWRERMAYNQQAMRNRQDNINSLRDNDTRRFIANSGNQIDAANVAGQNQLRGIQGQATQFELEQGQEAADLQNRYAAADAAGKKQLEPEMIARGFLKPQTPNVIKLDTYDRETGYKSGQRGLVQGDDGVWNDINVGQKEYETPTEASIQHMIKNKGDKQLMALFVSRFGEHNLPPELR